MPSASPIRSRPDVRDIARRARQLGSISLAGGLLACTAPDPTRAPSGAEGGTPGSEVGSESSSATGSSGSEGSSDTEADSGSGSESDSESGGAIDCRPLLAEVLYDAAAFGDDPSDDGYQWVKIYNPCPMEIDLSDHTIGYGIDSYTLGSKGFGGGRIAAGGCFVVGGPEVADQNGSPAGYDYADDFSTDLRAPDVSGVGIALFDVPADRIDTAIPVDVVVYGPNNAAALIGPDGVPVDGAHVGGVGPGESLLRTSPTTWEANPLPTPNACPSFEADR